MDQEFRMLPLRHILNQIYIEYVTDMKNAIILFNKENNAINVTRVVNSIRKRKTASHADTKEHNYRTMVRKYSCRNNTRGWLVQGNLRSFLGPGRKFNYDRTGRRLR